MNVSVFGLGYVGCVTAACLARDGHHVVGVDVNAEKVARMIRRNAHTAQFVQISLRKVTLKESDHIVGVTMTPTSVSEVIMRVNLADIEDEKPQEAIVA